MNKYEVIKTIGEGAYGVVLQCRNKESGELVAIKRFKESDEDELVRKTTLREVKILRLLKDQSFVVKLQEAFRRKGKLYLVFNYVGCNLLDVLDQFPQGVCSEEVKTMTFSMLMGVRACHANNVIHRDIKPENLLVHNDNMLRLCDFGFARIYSPGMNELTDYVATRWYRSPELLLGTTDYGFPSDIWAVGCIMAELIDGQAIFPGETEVDQIFMIQKLLGNLTHQQSEIFNRNPRFRGFTIRDLSRTETTLDRKFQKKANKKVISLLKQMLVIDPDKRCTVDEAILHPLFEGLVDRYCPEVRNTTAITRPSSSICTITNISSKVSFDTFPNSTNGRCYSGADVMIHLRDTVGGSVGDSKNGEQSPVGLPPSFPKPTGPSKPAPIELPQHRLGSANKRPPSSQSAFIPAPLDLNNIGESTSYNGHQRHNNTHISSNMSTSSQQNIINNSMLNLSGTSNNIHKYTSCGSKMISGFPRLANTSFIPSKNTGIISHRHSHSQYSTTPSSTTTSSLNGSYQPCNFYGSGYENLLSSSHVYSGLQVPLVGDMNDLSHHYVSSGRRSSSSGGANVTPLIHKMGISDFTNTRDSNVFSSNSDIVPDILTLPTRHGGGMHSSIGTNGSHGNVSYYRRGGR